jgi:hypothetical protein
MPMIAFRRLATLSGTTTKTQHQPPLRAGVKGEGGLTSALVFRLLLTIIRLSNPRHTHRHTRWPRQKDACGIHSRKKFVQTHNKPFAYSTVSLDSAIRDMAPLLNSLIVCFRAHVSHPHPHPHPHQEGRTTTKREPPFV